MQHLLQAVREIERRALVNLVFRSQSSGVTMRSKRMRHSTSVKPAFAICRSIFARKRSRSRRPIDIRMLVRDRREHVERAHPARRECRIGDARVLHVERRIVGENVLVLDLVEIARVVGGDVDVVMRQIVTCPRRRDTS